MARISSTDVADPFYTVLGHRPEILAAWQGLDQAMMGAGSTLPVALKENVRRALAQDFGCRFCASFGTPPDTPADVQESLALAFVERVTQDHTSVDARTFEVLREEFSEEQIVELCAWICFKLGANTLGAIVGLEPSTEEQRAGYEGWLADQAAATA
jgi:alkylhydroperoxidase family enzyme